MRVSIKLSTLNNFLFVGGSSLNTSKAAPDILPWFINSIRSSSTISPPLAQFIILTLSLHLERLFLFKIPLVLSVRGVCNVIKSEFFSISSSSTFSLQFFQFDL